MKFVYPEFLYALFALAIPIVIHLFNFRRYKTVYFTNVRFLKSVQEETQSTNKLKHLLVLFSRLLALAFLIFAFAQPILPTSDKDQKVGNSIVGIYIDNSFSMQSESENGQSLDIAKNKAINILDAFKPDDQFIILTNDFEAKHQRTINKEQFIEELQAVQLSPAVKSISESTARLKDIIFEKNVPNKSIFLISDFQKSTTNLDQLGNDSLVDLQFVPIKTNVATNLYIDSCWFYSPFRQSNSLEQLVVKIVNASDKNYENIPIRLAINGQTKTPGSFNIGPNQTTYDTLTYTNGLKGIQKGEISIKDYPITFDDHFFFTYQLESQLAIASLQENNKENVLNALFTTDDFIRLSELNIKQINYQELGNKRLVVINEVENYTSGFIQELKKYVDNGGHLMIFPDKSSSHNQNALLTPFEWQVGKRINTPTKVDYINEESLIYRNVFDELPKNLNLPLATSYYELPSSGEVIMRFQNRKPFLISKSVEKGRIYLAATSLSKEESNLTEHAIFVPTLYNIALNSQQSNALSYTINENNQVRTTAQITGEKPMSVVGNSIDFIPEQRKVDRELALFIHGQITEAGNYTIKNGEEAIQGVALNYDRKESNLAAYSEEELTDLLLKSELKNYTVFTSTNELLTNEIANKNSGIALWKYAILLCLLFLGCEVLLLRFYH
tara:strand:- start:4012 stop:6027 length:2016 start_codon:yes stop_codon:yes gene_type:complete